MNLSIHYASNLKNHSYNWSDRKNRLLGELFFYTIFMWIYCNCRGLTGKFFLCRTGSFMSAEKNSWTWCLLGGRCAAKKVYHFAARKNKTKRDGDSPFQKILLFTSIHSPQVEHNNLLTISHSSASPAQHITACQCPAMFCFVSIKHNVEQLTN